MGAVFFLGLDGGGTGCRARLVDSAGRLLGEGRAGPATMRLGIDRAWPAMMAAADMARAQAGLTTGQHVIHAAAGIAGINRDGAQAALAMQPHPFATFVFTSDSRAACLGAHGGADGGIVIAGTGSIGFAIAGERDIRIGGYGIPVSDEGSGAACGIAAVGALLRAADGRIAPGAFTQALSQRFDGGTQAVVAFMDRATASDYAAFAPLVFDHAQAGDPVASAIARQAGADIGALIAALAARETRRIALLGGLAARLAAWLPPAAQARLSPPMGDGVDGALILARRAVTVA